MAKDFLRGRGLMDESSRFVVVVNARVVGRIMKIVTMMKGVNVCLQLCMVRCYIKVEKPKFHCGARLKATTKNEGWVCPHHFIISFFFLTN